MQINADWAGETVAWLQSRKIDARAILDQLGIDHRDLQFGKQILAHHFAAILDYAAAQTQDRHLGLHCGGAFHIKSGGVLAYLAASSETVAAAVSNYQRYAAVVCDGFVLELERDYDGVRMSLRVADPVWKECRHLGHFVAARMISGLRKITGVEISPLSVHFGYPQPESTEECRRFFRCGVEYGGPTDVIKLSHDVMAIPIPTADNRLGQMLRSYADTLLGQVRDKDAAALEDRVSAIIAHHLASGRASLSQVARELNLSERTFRRRLRDSNLSFSELVRRVRINLAGVWLTKGGFDVKHISFLLGYSEPAAFSRAYKRWTGRSPGHARN